MKKIILDCDPGHDDAIALMLAYFADELELVGVSAVGGNSGLDNTVRNARRVLDFIGAYNVPVRAGCDRPMLQPLHNESGIRVHGRDGLGGVALPEAVTPIEPEHAVPWIIRTLRESRDPVYLVATGPLTNVAQVLLQAPDVRERLTRIVIMGGAVYAPGNINSAAEFNFYIDPEAAKVVLQSGCGCDLVTLDVTMKALFREEDAEALRAQGSAAGRLAAELLGHYGDNLLDGQGRRVWPIHDALCIGTLIDESLVQWEEAHVEVAVHDPLTRGETVASFHGTQAPNCRIGTAVDRDRFVELLKANLAKG